MALGPSSRMRCTGMSEMDPDKRKDKKSNTSSYDEKQNIISG